LLKVLFRWQGRQEIFGHFAPAPNYAIKLFIEADELPKGVAGYRKVYVHRPRLADPIDAISCLGFESRIPPTAAIQMKRGAVTPKD
jgi:hypothetical protein